MNTAFTDSAASLMHGESSDVGKRPNQEDRWVVREFPTADGRTAILALVADGIGGHSTGEMASHMAEELIPAHLENPPPSASELTRRLKAALAAAGQKIYDASLVDANRAGMGTTCTAIAIADRRLYLAHVGDSRAYLLRGGKLRQLTIDHTWAEEAIRAGRSPDEIRTHPNRGVIMRYLGIDPTVSVDTRCRVGDNEISDTLDGPFHLEPGDTLLLCSDGVSDAVEPRAMAEFMAHPECQAAADALVAAAPKAGATDNVTAVVLRLPGGVVAPPLRGPKAAALKVPLRILLPAVLALIAIVTVIALLLSGRDPGRATPAPGATAGISTAPPATQAVPVTATARPTQTGGGVQVATAESSTPTPASTPAPPAPSVEVAPPSTPGDAGAAPTIVPTSTAAPTRTPVRSVGTPALPTDTRVPQVTPRSGAGGVDLLTPIEGEKIIGQTSFSWRPQSTLKMNVGERYELIVWGEGEDPLTSGRSPVGATAENSVTVNLTGVEVALNLADGRTYYWGVRLIGTSGLPLRMLSDGRRFVYGRDTNGNSSSPRPDE